MVIVTRVYIDRLTDYENGTIAISIGDGSRFAEFHRDDFKHIVDKRLVDMTNAELGTVIGWLIAAFDKATVS